MTLAIQSPITRDPGPMTLAIGWPHDPGENAVPWPHGPGDRHPLPLSGRARLLPVHRPERNLVATVPGLNSLRDQLIA